MERLQKFLAQCGIASRRHAEQLILEGRVQVNGKKRAELGVKVDPDVDRVTVDGREVRPSDSLVYIALNKPIGYVTTAHDPQGRPTVMDLLDGVSQRVFSVGRLDLDSEGLLLLTNDGDFSFAMTHPRHEVVKEYHVTVLGTPEPDALDRLRKGVVLDGRATAPAKADILAAGNGHATLRVEIHEGRKRQVRRMLQTVGHPVVTLRRVRIGPIRLKGLKPGEFRRLTDEELTALRSQLDWRG